VPYRRLLRKCGDAVEADAVVVNSASEAAEFLSKKPGNVLITTGAKELKDFSGLEPSRLFPRVLPTYESLAACEAAGIPHHNILAMQGPFSQELNEALIRQFHIAALVTKDGGKAGGFTEKVLAAKQTGITLILIRRPEETGETFEEIVTSCEELMRCL
jgi:precorrin-6x reductase